jgi:hypothetical protein
VHACVSVGDREGGEKRRKRRRLIARCVPHTHSPLRDTR